MSSSKDICRICNILVIFLSFASFVLCHTVNKVILNHLEEDMTALNEGQDNIRLRMGALKEYLADKIEESASDDESLEPKEAETEPEDPMSNPKVKNFVDRLDKLEKNIEAVESFVRSEGETDSFLNGLRGNIGEAFENDMQQVKNLAANMREELKGSFVSVDHDLKAVNDFANSRNVIIGGVLYYDGIGSACGSSFDVCRVEHSECRDGICQCETGLSHDSLHEKCTDVCEDGYGSTYQTVHNYIIRGYNNATLNETSLEDCKELCETQDTCRSFDYFPRFDLCCLSEVVKGEVEDEAWEYNSVGIHFQRDCIVNRQ